MKVLIADKFEKAGVDGLKAPAARSSPSPTRPPTTWAPCSPSTRPMPSSRVDEGEGPAFAKADSLRLIARGRRRRQHRPRRRHQPRRVRRQLPGMNSSAVAELTWALILACDRVPDQAQQPARASGTRRSSARPAPARARSASSGSAPSARKSRMGKASACPCSSGRALTDDAARELASPGPPRPSMSRRTPTSSA